MAGTKKSYLLMPNFDCPSNGPVALGQIITSPFDPESAINTVSRLPPAEIFHSSKTAFQTLIEKESSRNYGVWSRFLGLSILGGEAGFLSSRSNSSYMYISRLNTDYFNPTIEYIEKSLRHPQTLKALSQQNFEKNIYMITGIKIAIGANMQSLSTKKQGMNLDIGVDLTTLGVPLQAGPKLEPSSAQREGTAFSNSTDFVFAYRLREIYYSQKRGLIKTANYTKGAAYGLENDLSTLKDGEHGAEFEDDVEIDGIADTDLGNNDLREFGRPLTAVDEEDGVECECYSLPAVSSK
ncbi:uncharacterized protein N7496_000078 [Penicillium cataractarum]|uniref:Uncharacterized protein n=1 Tax=Penicillium cataractarum TaxID=2100454 RepID=A0A9W9VTM8_9EURO|nr:uncharacterized protein N7496_000078 [Penicillium cataractarum]KAJ5389010.1 hypothetical protein N7496_000078 [Penicillium cataractarum]